MFDFMNNRENLLLSGLVLTAIGQLSYMWYVSSQNDKSTKSNFFDFVNSKKTDVRQDPNYREDRWGSADSAARRNSGYRPSTDEYPLNFTRPSIQSLTETRLGLNNPRLALTDTQRGLLDLPTSSPHFGVFHLGSGNIYENAFGIVSKSLAELYASFYDNPKAMCQVDRNRPVYKSLETLLSVNEDDTVTLHVNVFSRTEVVRRQYPVLAKFDGYETVNPIPEIGDRFLCRVFQGPRGLEYQLMFLDNIQEAIALVGTFGMVNLSSILVLKSLS